MSLDLAWIIWNKFYQRSEILDEFIGFIDGEIIKICTGQLYPAIVPDNQAIEQTRFVNTDGRCNVNTHNNMSGCRYTDVFMFYHWIYDYIYISYNIYGSHYRWYMRKSIAPTHESSSKDS